MRAFGLLAETMSVESLRLLRYAFQLDLRDAESVETRLFADGRIRVIERELRRRGEPLEVSPVHSTR